MDLHLVLPDSTPANTAPVAVPLDHPQPRAVFQHRTVENHGRWNHTEGPVRLALKHPPPLERPDRLVAGAPAEPRPQPPMQRPLIQQHRVTRPPEADLPIQLPRSVYRHTGHLQFAA